MSFANPLILMLLLLLLIRATSSDSLSVAGKELVDLAPPTAGSSAATRDWVLAQGDTRPMDDHPKAMQQLRQLLDAREPKYASADLTVDSSGLPPDQVADAIVEWVEA